MMALDAIANTVGTVNQITKSVTETLELLKSQNTQSTTDINDREGFAQIQNTGVITTYNIPLSKFQNFLNICFNCNIFNALEQHIKTYCTTTLVDDLNLALITESDFTSKVYDLCYNNGYGLMNIFHLKITPINPTSVSIEKSIIANTFTPSQSYVIISESSHNLLRSKCSQHIEYLPSNLRPEHFNSILKFNADMIEKIS